MCKSLRFSELFVTSLLSFGTSQIRASVSRKPNNRINNKPQKMNNIQAKEHWETVYETKNPDQVSWTQEIPKTSLDFITSLQISKEANIIDIGGGDSKLVDCLLDLGYQNISVLDISGKAIERAKKRLGDKAKNVNWIVSNVTEFQPTSVFDVWHDRAAFHFLTTKEEISNYVETAHKSVCGYVIIGTFSENGPTRCSGLEIKQYSEQTITHEFQN